MSRSFLTALVAALVLLLGVSGPARAASLGTVDAAIGFTLNDGVEITDDGANLIIVNAAGTALTSVGLSIPGGGLFDLFIFGDSLGASGPVVSLAIDGAEGSLEGDLVGSGVAAGVIELLFSVTRDDFNLFGDRVLLVLSGDFSASLNATAASAIVNPLVAPTPIPLPAGLPLLATALAGAALLRRRA